MVDVGMGLTDITTKRWGYSMLYSLSVAISHTDLPPRSAAAYQWIRAFSIGSNKCEGPYTEWLKRFGTPFEEPGANRSFIKFAAYDDKPFSIPTDKIFEVNIYANMECSLKRGFYTTGGKTIMKVGPHVDLTNIDADGYYCGWRDQETGLAHLRSISIVATTFDNAREIFELAKRGGLEPNVPFSHELDLRFTTA